MPLTLSLRFPTGRYVAAAWDDKDRAEWPPHPARLALAFIDDLHKVGNPEDLRPAVDWLCAQSPPALVIRADVDVQTMDGFFVSQNPAAAEGPKHSRKPRSFPSVFLDGETPAVFFHWPLASPETEIMDDLRELAGRLPRLGHSSSLVVAEFTNEDPPSGDGWLRLEPTSDAALAGDHRLRVAYPGIRSAAEDAYDAEGRAAEMDRLVQASARTAKGGKLLKPAVSPRGRHDPPHRWQGYVEPVSSSAQSSPWDHRLLVLAETGGSRLGLVSTWQITEVFHKTLLDRWGRDPARGPVPAWISGHRPGDSVTGPALESLNRRSRSS